MAADPRGSALFSGGRNPVGQFVGEFVTPATWPILARTGMDFGVIDMEHGGLTYREVANALVGARATELPALVRVPELSRSAIGRVLDLGADGVLVPHIESERDAAELVRWAKYAPIGERSAGSPFIDTEAANAGVAAIPIVESPAGADAIEAICATPGIDAVIVGPADLSLLLGAIGDFATEAFRECETRILDGCRRAGIPIGTGTITATDAVERVGRGYDWIVVGSEVPILEQGATEAVGLLQTAFAETRSRA